MMEYHTTNKSIVQRTALSKMSGREKCSLFRDLMKDLRITERFMKEVDMAGLDSVAVRIIDEQLSKFW